MRILIALLAVCLGSAVLWASLDRPLDAPDWRGEMKGMSYSPSGLYDESQLEEGVPEAVIRQDLERMSTMTKRIRTYTVDHGLDIVIKCQQVLGAYAGTDDIFPEYSIVRRREAAIQKFAGRLERDIGAL